MRLALTDQEEQEDLALGDILAWFNVSSALQCIQEMNQSATC